MNHTPEIENKCNCVPRGKCFRCVKMEIKAHNNGFNMAINSVIKYIEGKKTVDRFSGKNVEQLKSLIATKEQQAVEGFATQLKDQFANHLVTHMENEDTGQSVTPEVVLEVDKALSTAALEIIDLFLEDYKNERK
jgi:hypothetical protein